MPSALRGAVSQLQEFVQAARVYPMPTSCPVLHWIYDTRIADSKLEFRATVGFLLDGVPHHTVGEWRFSKKVAQRDVAERALELFVGHWGEVLLMSGSPISRKRNNWDRNCAPYVNGDSARFHVGKKDPLQDLEEFSACFDITPPEWKHVRDGDRYKAFVEIVIFDVPHTLCGAYCDSLRESYEDVARRVLWYLQYPGYEDTYEPDDEYVKSVMQEIPEPAQCWSKDTGLSEEGQELAERKTVLMRVQNRLQQAFGRHLQPGTSVWYWTFEKGPKTKSKTSQSLLRATARIPLAGRVFVGSWHAGQREAQIDVCAQITHYLDAEFAWTRGI